MIEYCESIYHQNIDQFLQSNRAKSIEYLFENILRTSLSELFLNTESEYLTQKFVSPKKR